MSLTEEQLEAIRAVSDLPRAIGCQLCHPYIMENYGSHFIVLRDMIDSSGTVEPTGGFDLERARGLRDFLQDDCAEVGDVWGEMIAEIERLRAENEEALESLTAAYLLGRHEKAQEVAARPKEGKIDSSEHVTEPTKMIGFDLEKARAADEALPYPLDANEIWVSGKGQMHINPPNAPSIFFTLSDLCEFRNLFHGQAAEIERLRPFEIAARDLDSDLTKIAGERDDQAARIKELEDAHKRSGAKYAKIINELRSSVYANIPGLDVGKIGPDAKPRSWQITEERVGLLEYCLESLLDAPDIEESAGPRHSIELIRAMLKEAE